MTMTMALNLMTLNVEKTGWSVRAAMVRSTGRRLCRRCRAPFVRLCTLHVLKAGSSVRDQLQA